MFCFSSTVKYEAPGNISVSWLKNNLSLVWRAAEKYPALAEVWFRRDKHPIESWEKVRHNCDLLSNLSKSLLCLKKMFVILYNHFNPLSTLLLQRKMTTTISQTSMCEYFHVLYDEMFIQHYFILLCVIGLSSASCGIISETQ